MYEEICPYNGLLHICYDKIPCVVTFKSDVDDAFAIKVLIVVLLPAIRGRQSASEILLAQDLGKTLTAAPVSIKYLHLLHLSATYNNLEGNNLGSVASAESCRVSVISPGARVATLLWPSSLKRMHKGLDMCVLYHRKSGDNSRRVY